MFISFLMYEVNDVIKTEYTKTTPTLYIMYSANKYIKFEIKFTNSLISIFDNVMIDIVITINSAVNIIFMQPITLECIDIIV